jgi:high-affinity iron transporter
MDFSTILPTLIVTLREGFEATLIVGIVLTCLQKAQQQKYYRWVYGGVVVGIFASILVGLFLWQSLAQLGASSYVYAPFLQQLWKTVLVLIAIVMLSWMLIWMSKQAKFLKGEVESSLHKVITGNNNAGIGIFLLVFIAVLREGFETVFFINAQIQNNILGSCLGAIVGLSLAVLMGWGLFYWGIKINIRLFFQVMGIFLLLIVSGLVISLLKNLDAAVTVLQQINSDYGYLCFFHQGSCLLGFPLWDMSNILPDSQFPGVLLKTLLGYRDHIYVLQLITYFLFITIVGNLYLNSLQENK